VAQFRARPGGPTRDLALWAEARAHTPSRPEGRGADPGCRPRQPEVREGAPPRAPRRESSRPRRNRRLVATLPGPSTPATGEQHPLRRQPGLPRAPPAGYAPRLPRLTTGGADLFALPPRRGGRPCSAAWPARPALQAGGGPIERLGLRHSSTDRLLFPLTSSRLTRLPGPPDPFCETASATSSSGGPTPELCRPRGGDRPGGGSPRRR